MRPLPFETSVYWIYGHLYIILETSVRPVNASWDSERKFCVVDMTWSY